MPTSTSNAVYQLDWIEWFDPADTNGTNQVVNSYSVKFKGNGGTQYVGRAENEFGTPGHTYATLSWNGEEGSDFVIDPPTTEMKNGVAKLDALKMLMVRPDDKEHQKYYHFSFNDAAIGVCSIPCNIEVSPNNQITQDLLDSRITGTIEAVSGSMLTWVNGAVMEYSIAYTDWRETATFTNLPIDNSAFGEKNVSFTVGNIGFTQSGKTKIFFNRDAMNHPGDGVESTPNWYFYWSQTGANFGMNEYYGPGADGNGRSYTDFIDGQWRARIGSGEVTGGVTISGVSYPAGIDNFAFTTRHEEQHRLDMIALWGASNDRNAANDTDGDHLPDDREPHLVPNHAYDPNRVATYDDVYGYGAGWSDVEDYALRRQEFPTVGAYKSVDWANPGSQWGSGQSEY